MAGPSTPPPKPSASRQIASTVARLPQGQNLPTPSLPRNSGSVTYIADWIAANDRKRFCDACEGMGFCLRCDAAGCDDCRGGLCEHCHGMGVKVDQPNPAGGPEDF